MNKFDEMKMLQSLKGDTYFNQYFSSEDIDQMCQNIENDFAIESDCSFAEKADAVQKDYSNRIATMAEAIIEANPNKEITEVLDKDMGIDWVIKTKHKKGIKLSDAEIDYLVRTL